MKNKIISSYNVIDNGKKSISMPSKIPKIAKSINIDNKIKKQIGGSLLPQESKNPVITKEEKPQSPQININRNEDGIIVSIDIKCLEPAEFSISFNYS